MITRYHTKWSPTHGINKNKMNFKQNKGKRSGIGSMKTILFY